MIFSIISIMIPPIDNTSVDVYAASDTATCSECNGTGNTKEYGICSVCDGNGDYLGYHPNGGYGRFTCYQCNGVGTTYNKVVCEACSGTGNVSKTDTVIITYHLTGGYAEGDPDPIYGTTKTVTTLTQTKLKCETINLLKTKPYKPNNKFVGWTNQPFSTTGYAPGDEYKYNNRTDLYAIWVPLCDECDGIGKVEKGECSVCNGEGYTYNNKCYSCNGSGKVTITYKYCPMCSGSGIAYIGTEPVTCPICNGTGSGTWNRTITCQSCNGTGYHGSRTMCTYCEGGVVYVKCDTCNGTMVGKYEIIYGDTNLDDKVNIADAILLQKYLLCASEIDYAQWIISDINGDQTVNAVDLVLLNRKLLYQDN